MGGLLRCTIAVLGVRQTWRWPGGAAARLSWLLGRHPNGPHIKPTKGPRNDPAGDAEDDA
jgi:hypothetical protein